MSDQNLLLEKQLLEMICYQVQVLKPENIPKPPYNLGTLHIPAPLSQKPVETSQLPATSAPTSASTPSKQKDKSAPKSKPAAASHPQPGQKGDASSRQLTVAKLCLPIPPEPYPPLSSRLSAYSPAISSGVLIETIKAGMNAQADAGPAPGSGSGGMGGIGKGKRKLVRVRQ
jgi:signal recognition particle subunit SRP19